MHRFSNETNKNKTQAKKKTALVGATLTRFHSDTNEPSADGLPHVRILNKHLAVDLATAFAAGASGPTAAQKTKPNHPPGHWPQAAEPLLDAVRSPTSFHPPRRIATATATGRPRAPPAPTSTKGCGMKLQRLGQGQQRGVHLRPGHGSDLAAPREAPMAASGGSSAGPGEGTRPPSPALGASLTCC